MTPPLTPGRGAEALPPPSPWNIANALTMFRVVLVPVVGWLLLVEGGENPLYRYLAAATFAIAMITDRIDGNLARSRGLITKFGQIVDPIADKALMTMAFVGLSMIGVVWWWVTALVLIREWGVTLLRFVVIRHGVMPAGRGGKVKVALQTGVIIALTLPLWTWPLGQVILWVAYAVLAVTVAVTLITGYEILRDALRLRQTSERAERKRAARAVRRRRP
ncbi:MAG: CDP-alcohol phosphatidyltransferase family protein [Intrasporangiaceae bacterium]|nr:CDP-alcohol phosphatidyltransferase family protein [Intrasporangiaceae bacterium]